MATDMDLDDPRGTKRKADDDAPAQPKRIKALAEDVVNRIAAGEIIVAPMHALKEMIENSVDAGSTSIEIVVKDGGLKLLQITDNGHGIHKDDLPILCHRHTTSKLKEFDDLYSISTYGFRGEALASISHIAHLRITTKTNESSCAWQAYYADGKLVPAKPGQKAEPKPTAGRQGTQITVEDLFYNVPQRRKAFRSPSEEYAKVLDVVGRYAVHCEGSAFSCKKHADNSLGLSVSANASKVERIGNVHGHSLAKELIPFEMKDEKLAFAVSGYASNANYHVKKTTLLLFINHRSVESQPIKQAIQRMYSVFLPKGGHPFVYVSLEIAPERVDVNVHPTKREVRFLNEDEIIDSLCDSIRAELSRIDTSRTFLTQSLLPGSNSVEPLTTKSPQAPAASQKGASSRPAENNLVRTDPTLRKITSMLGPASGPGASELSYTVIEKPRLQIRLTSVKELRASVREQMHQGLTDTLSSHTWVGIVDLTRRVAAIQGGVKLFLVDYGMLSNEFFYQLGLTDFGNFGTIAFDSPLDIRELIRCAAELEEEANSGLDLSAAPEKVTKQLIDRRDMLLEYFSMEVSDDGKLLAMPLLLKNYMPCMGKLPRFLLRLGPCVNWDHEKECFRTFLSELASFHVPEHLENPPPKRDDGQEEDPDATARRQQVEHMLEHVLFPALKARLVATKGLLKGVLEVANLKGLYRIFERC